MPGGPLGHGGRLLGCLESGWLGRDGGQAGFRPNRLGKIENPFSFSNMFYKFQTNLNSNQI
jgi:hypothetical protein